MRQLTLEERQELFCKKYNKNKLYGEDLEHDDLDKHDIPREVETNSKKDI
jgi:hypothetical protein